MPTAFCSLDQAYGNWNTNKQQSNQGNQHQQQQQKQQQKQQQQNQFKSEEPFNQPGNFCPNCKNCLDKNNIFQQKVIEQNIWPRPRWIPESYPSPYESHDPYNRYWMNTFQPERRENFSNKICNNSEGTIKLIMFILVSLFLIQFFEMIFKLTNELFN